MLDFFKRKRQRGLGVDIGTCFVKMLAFNQTSEGKCIENYAIVELPPFNPTLKKNETEALYVKALQTAFQKLETNNRQAIIALTNSLVFTAKIQVAESSKTPDILQHIELKADTYFPYPLDELYYDFEIVRHSATEGVLEVIVIAARKEMVDTRIRLLEKAGLKVVVVETESQAIARAFGAPLKNQIVLDLGSHKMSLHAFFEKRLIYSRDFSFQNSKEDALQKIEQDINIFLSAHSNIEIERFLLMGGNALMPELSGLISTKFQAEVALVNPFSELKFSEKREKEKMEPLGSLLMLSYGLALRGIDI